MGVQDEQVGANAICVFVERRGSDEAIKFTLTSSDRSFSFRLLQICYKFEF